MNDEQWLKYKPEPTLNITDDDAYWILDNIVYNCEEVFINKYGNIVPKIRASEVDCALFIVGFTKFSKNKFIRRVGRV